MIDAPSNTPPIREILRKGDFVLHIENMQEGYSYAWQRFGGQSGTQHIARDKTVGWRPVTGDDPENPGQRDANGWCVIGDVALMKIPAGHLQEIQADIAREVESKRGRDVQENLLQSMNEELSRAFGRRVNVTFAFDDHTQLANRRKI